MGEFQINYILTAFFLLAVAMATAILVHNFCEVYFFSSKERKYFFFKRKERSSNKYSQLEQTTIWLVYSL